MMIDKRIGSALAAIIFCLTSVVAQQPNSEAMRWRYIGPVGNRTTSIAGVPGQPYIYYAGSASGGIFKTTDGGIHWDAIFDSQPVSSIGSVAVAPSDPNVVWAGTGEAWIRSHISVGQGIYKSTDAGRTWTSLSATLPKNGPVWAVAEDHVNANLLFTGTEFGLFFSVDGGQKWVQLKGGMPVIAVRDLNIQKRENDLVVATFGRGIYILDNYTPLRSIKPETLRQDAAVFPVKDALMYI